VAFVSANGRDGAAFFGAAAKAQTKLRKAWKALN